MAFNSGIEHGHLGKRIPGLRIRLYAMGEAGGDGIRARYLLGNGSGGAASVYRRGSRSSNGDRADSAGPGLVNMRRPRSLRRHDCL